MTQLGWRVRGGHGGVAAAMDWSEVQWPRWISAATVAAAPFVVLDGEEQREGEQTSEWDRDVASVTQFCLPNTHTAPWHSFT